MSGKKFSLAVVVLNRRVDGTPSQVTVPLRELGLDSEEGYHVRELNEHKDVGFLSQDQALRVDVNPSGNMNNHGTGTCSVAMCKSIS